MRTLLCLAVIAFGCENEPDALDASVGVICPADVDSSEDACTVAGQTCVVAGGVYPYRALCIGCGTKLHWETDAVAVVCIDGVTTD